MFSGKRSQNALFVPSTPRMGNVVKLLVELDGSQHAGSESDAIRDRELRSRGFRILRVWNNELTKNKNGILEAILAAVLEATGQAAPPSSALRAPSPIKGEGRSSRPLSRAPSP